MQTWFTHVERTYAYPNKLPTLRKRYNQNVSPIQIVDFKLNRALEKDTSIVLHNNENSTANDEEFDANIAGEEQERERVINHAGVNGE